MDGHARSDFASSPGGSPSSDAGSPTRPMVGDDDRVTLLRAAKESVRHGLYCRLPLPVTLHDYAPTLHPWRATFVTLRINDTLRGCIGSLEARRPLIVDVVENAYAAAFRDARFAPLSTAEFSQFDVHISVLSPPSPMTVADEADLLSQLRPHVDGLILLEPPRRATFLPDVWQSAPDPRDFVAQLKRKGGWPAEYWSASMQVMRYTTEGF